ncbi:SDR family oxidoreductase [Rhizobiaceae sp. 2RAB30]
MLAAETLKDNVLLVTGAGTGIGQVFAARAAAQGADVVLIGRRADRLEDTARLVRDKGRRALVCAFDIRDPDAVEANVARAADTFGRLDGLVNNAAGNFLVHAEALSPNGWNAVVGTVLNGTAYMTLAAGRHMITQRRGKIVSISASFAWTGGPGTVHSASAKAGVIAMTRSLAVEWGPHNVQVNCLCPGFIDTPQSREVLWPTEAGRKKILATIPAGRFGTIDEAVDVGLMLCSPMADYITGEVLTIDGGQWLNKGVFEIPARQADVSGTAAAIQTHRG